MNNYTVSVFAFMAIVAIGSIGIITIDVHADMDDDEIAKLAPAKQVEMGVDPNDVTCKNDQVLLIRTNGDPICVNETSVDRLVSMGIATVPDVSESTRGADEMMEAKDDKMDEMMEAKDDKMDEMMEAKDDKMDEMMEAKDDKMDEMMEAKDDKMTMTTGDLVVSMTGFSDRFDEMREDAKATTQEAIDMYDEHGTGAFDMITEGAEMLEYGNLYPFVLKFDTMNVVAHGFNPERVDENAAEALSTLKDTVEDIQERLKADGETWSMYTTTNPDNGKEEIKKSYMMLHDGYIFGSGFYLKQLEADMIVAMWVAESAAMMYEEDGVDAFDAINNAAEEYMAGDIYPFVADVETAMIVAHGADPEHVGETSITVTEANKSLDQILAESEQNGGTWVTYEFVNYETNEESYKVTWVTIQDDYLVGAGFYPEDSDASKVRAMMSVDMALAMYAEHGTDAFEMITALNVDNDWYPFVLEDDTGVEVADGSIFDRTNAPVMEMYEHRAFTANVRDALESGQGAFTTYVFTNPTTNENQPKKSWVILVDGYVFGAGLYLEGEWADMVAAKWSVSKAIELYKMDAEEAITSINEMMSNEETYPFILNSDFVVVANGADPKYVGTDVFELVTPDKDKDQILEELHGGMAMSWISYTFVNPETGDESAEKISILKMHDGHIFGAGYYPEPEESTDDNESMTDDSNGDHGDDHHDDES